MIRHWTVFQGGPNLRDRVALRVTLSPKKVFLLNQAVFDAIGRPAAVELCFDEGTKAIGLRPQDPRRPNTFPVRERRSSASRGRTGKYSYRLIFAAPFCKHFDIRPSTTMLFNHIDMENDGTLVLDLNKATVIGRGSR